eukprot:TRINITY_DN9523_c0_g1_i3.p1 TRINITY_DN9523_c0_g1~~TRINITY_DN9523_c0_g1_i3.p1  ORF type:complete len:116 (-),score=18.63 TRINITY_DN9523_c0_g1_i3:176-502(-)
MCIRDRVENESMKPLRMKLIELRKYKESLEREINMDETDIKSMEKKVEKIQEEIQPQDCDEKRTRFQRMDEVLQKYNESYAKLVESAGKLKQILAGELSSLKNPSEIC